MPQQDLIRANVGPQDAHLFSRQNSMFKPQKHSAYNDRVRERLQISPISNSGLGGTLVFEVDRIGDRLEDVLLRLNFSAVTTTGGTFRRLQDYAKLAAVREAQIRYGPFHLKQLFPEENYADYALTMTDEKKEVYERQTLGNKTIAERNTAALGPQEGWLKLCTYWEGLRGHAPSIASLASKLRFEFTLNRAQDIVQTDGTAPIVTLDPEPVLDAQMFHTTGYERQAHTASTMAGDGLIRLFREVQIQRDEVVSAGTTRIPIKLTSFDAPISEFVVFVRPQTDMTTPLASDYYGSISSNTAILPDRVSIQTGQRFLYEVHEKRFIDEYITGKYHSSRPGHGLITLPLSEMPEMKNYAMGSTNAATINDMRLILEWDVATSVPLTVDIMGYAHNWINEYAGKLKTIWG